MCEGGEGIGVMNKFNSSNTNTEITQQQETKRKTKKHQNKKRTKKASSSSIPSSGDGASLRQSMFMIVIHSYMISKVE